MVAKVLWKSSRRKKVKKSYVNYKNKNMPDVDSIKKEERKKVYIKNIIIKKRLVVYLIDRIGILVYV